MKLSVVIPVYNGEHTIAALVEQLSFKLESLLHEVILVNDGSADRSEAVCDELAARFPFVTFVSLRRNFGEHNAVMCGLNYVTGDWAAIIDDDFQNPPEEILALAAAAEKGYDVVYSKYERRYHAPWRIAGSWFHNQIASLLLDKPQDLYLSSFKLIKREVIEEIIRYKGPFPYIDGLIFRVTKNVGTCVVEHRERQEGRSTYTLRKLIALYLNMFLNFSIWPLRIFTLAGAVFFFLGSSLALATVLEKLIYPSQVPIGWASVMTAVVAFSGLQLLCLGLIGEYLGKQYLDQNGTPQWVVKRSTVAGQDSARKPDAGAIVVNN